MNYIGTDDHVFQIKVLFTVKNLFPAYFFTNSIVIGKIGLL